MAPPKEEAMNEMKELAKDTRGSNFVEYMIICGVVALLAIVAFTQFGTDVQQKIQEEGTAVSGIQTQ
jgi:pilus assembly protein Flp/PilA